MYSLTLVINCDIILTNTLYMIHSQINKVKGLLSQFSIQLKEDVRVLKTANAFMKDVDPFVMWSTWYKAMVSGLFSLGTFTFVGYGMQSVIKNLTAGKSLTTGLLIIAISVFIIYQFVKVTIDALEEFRRTKFNAKVEAYFEKKILEKNVSLDMARLTDPEFYDKHRHSGRYGSITEVFKCQSDILSSIIGVVASFAIVAVLNPFVLIIGLLPFIPETIVVFVYNKKRRSNRDGMHLYDRAKDTYYFTLRRSNTLIQAKLFKFVPFFFEKFIDYSNKNRDSVLALRSQEIKWKTSIEVLKTILSCLVLIYLGKGCLNGTVTFASLLMIVGSLKTLGSSMFRISTSFLSFKEDCKDYLEFESFMKLESVVDESNAHEIVLTQVPLLSMNNVCFSYPNSERIILDNCNLKIFPEESVAIVGRNGAGKSTILRLLSKVYLPSEGTVCINDKNTIDITQESLLNHLVYISQGAEVADLPLKEALTGSSEPDMDRLVKAAKFAEAHDLIMSRKDGYSLQIRSHWAREGENFSGGEYQRLALVSAFYRLLDPNMFIVLFDEPMSNCDIETRDRFYRTITSIPGKTVIAVAHDHQYLHYFNRVVEIKDGGVSQDLRTPKEISEYEDRELE